jgi:hypothetical protein
MPTAATEALIREAVRVMSSDQDVAAAESVGTGGAALLAPREAAVVVAAAARTVAAAQTRAAAEAEFSPAWLRTLSLGVY